MKYVAIICTLAAVVSGQVPSSVPLHFTKKGPTPGPAPCCSTPLFTYISYSIEVSLGEEGALATQTVKRRGAYDALATKLSTEFDVHLPNGTKRTYKLVADFKKKKGVVISDQNGTTVCQKVELNNPFPYEYIPDDCNYLGSVTIGNRALRVDVWEIIEARGENRLQTLAMVKRDDCVGFRWQFRLFHKDTKAELKYRSVVLEDYQVGICDRDYWFKIPAECGKVTRSLEIPAEIRRSFSGRRIF